MDNSIVLLSNDILWSEMIIWCIIIELPIPYHRASSMLLIFIALNHILGDGHYYLDNIITTNGNNIWITLESSFRKQNYW